MKKINKSWFTLVELIVVITILAILWTIAFISLQSYTKNARDWVRTSDIANITKTLELFISEKWFYPEPSNFTNILYSWAIVWTQWTVWDTVISNLKTINKKPTDPVYGNEYTFSVNMRKNEYQVWAVVEWENLANNFFVSKSYAALQQWIAYIKWNYNWRIAITNTWWKDYVFAVPTIISNDLSSNDLIDIVNNNKLIYWGLVGSPTSYNWYTDTTINTFSYLSSGANLLVFSWVLQKDLYWQWLFVMVDNLQNAYSWSVITWYSESIWEDKSELATYTWNTIKKIYWLPSLNTTKSCEEVLSSWKSTWNWFYQFFSNDNSSIFETYCDMTSWWWTFLFSVNPASIKWKFDSIEWTKPTVTQNLWTFNILTDEVTSWAYWDFEWKEVKVCRWNLTNCYVFSHNQNRTLKSFYNVWDNYTVYKRCYPHATWCNAWQLPDDEWDDSWRSWFLALVWDWANYESWYPKQWLGINLGPKNRLWLQLDNNNTWPDFDNWWVWIWVFRSRNCWYTWTFVDNTRARSVALNSSCAYQTPDNQMWYVFSK